MFKKCEKIFLTRVKIDQGNRKLNEIRIARKLMNKTWLWDQNQKSTWFFLTNVKLVMWNLKMTRLLIWDRVRMWQGKQRVAEGTYYITIKTLLSFYKLAFWKWDPELKGSCLQLPSQRSSSGRFTAPKHAYGKNITIPCLWLIFWTLFIVLLL